jgi:hypothetical protein
VVELRDLYFESWRAALIYVAAGIRSSSCQSDTNVEEVWIFLRSSAEDRVGKDDRVGLCPSDLVSDLWSIL